MQILAKRKKHLTSPNSFNSDPNAERIFANSYPDKINLNRFKNDSNLNKKQVFKSPCFLIFRFHFDDNNTHKPIFGYRSSKINWILYEYVADPNTTYVQYILMRYRAVLCGRDLSCHQWTLNTEHWTVPESQFWNSIWKDTWVVKQYNDAGYN